MRYPPTTHATSRRGALLLLVLTSLTFFMMVGTLMLLVATRSRTTSRAFANAANTTAANSLQARAILEESLLFILRGKRPTDEAALVATIASGTLPLAGQSILEDKYGAQTVTGSATPPTRLTLGQLSNFVPILTTTLSALAPAPQHPCDLNGRILTFNPGPGDGDVTSYRILRTVQQGGNSTVFLANLPTNRSPLLPRATCEVVINGREFCPETVSSQPANNEPYDAVASISDRWLASTPLAQSRPITTGVIQCSLSLNGTTSISELNDDADKDGLADGCDNDNDGVADSYWISGLVPDRPSPLGGSLRHDVAFLVRDLDGRVNLNAAGSLTSVVTATTDWPAVIATSTISGVEAGLGYGPADVAASRLVATGTHSAGFPGFPGRWPQLCRAGTSAPPQQVVPSADQRRTTPAVGVPVEGRYGPSGTNGSWSPGRSGSILDVQATSSLIGRSPTLFRSTVQGVSRLIGDRCASTVFLHARRVAERPNREPLSVAARCGRPARPAVATVHRQGWNAAERLGPSNR